jgi:hypothetical protein
VARGRGGFLQGRDVSAEAGRQVVVDLLVAQVLEREDRRRQHAGLFRLSAEEEAEHDRVFLDFLGEELVVIERGSKPFEGGAVFVDAAQVVGRERLEGREPRARVGFRERHVVAQHAHLVVVEQLPRHERELVAAPRPAPLGVETLLVDVEDDDARVERLRHEQAQARVVRPELELLKDAELGEVGLVDEEGQYDGDARADARGAAPGLGHEARE